MTSTQIEEVEAHRNGAVHPPGLVRVGIVNDYEIIVRGVAAMLGPYRDRIEVVALDTEGLPTRPMDIALFDTFAGRRHTLARAEEMMQSGVARHVVLYTWDAAAPFIAAARDLGISGIVLKTRSADGLVDALERVAAGERVGLNETDQLLASRVVELSDRESEVLALIAQGLTNAAIARELYLSVETVKTYVKRLYAKLDVHNRAQAAVAASDLQLTRR
jgi:DNA-binding NarL/FixJ family response regulator